MAEKGDAYFGAYTPGDTIIRHGANIRLLLRWYSLWVPSEAAVARGRVRKKLLHNSKGTIIKICLNGYDGECGIKYNI